MVPYGFAYGMPVVFVMFFQWRIYADLDLPAGFPHPFRYETMFQVGLNKSAHTTGKSIPC